jgi:ankyrin repeat protein
MSVPDSDPAPVRRLPEQPSLEQLRKQAKELLQEFRLGAPSATAEVNRFERIPEKSSFALNDAQRVLARAYGFASWPKLLIDYGAQLDIRDDLLQSTPLGWACRWGRRELVELLIQRGAPVRETSAEAWATPEAWAEKMGHGEILAILKHNSQ